MKQKYLLTALLTLPLTVFAYGPINTWYGGTTYVGTVETSGLIWNCTGGTCILKGPYGDGLNMAVCQDLSRKVGGLSYYYNDTGMVWSKTKNSALLDQCNGK